MLGPEMLATEKRLSLMNIVMGIQVRREMEVRRKGRRKGRRMGEGGMVDGGEGKGG